MSEMITQCGGGSETKNASLMGKIWLVVFDQKYTHI